ncbi:hypothetical protein GTA62_14725 [Roseobacter sp. HKCCD9010]|uniref:hypothetical protein n=1 Tax=unclassified Roseobacter TaxID=196798 RepID=UPI0014913F98|nr:MULTISPECIES: hypothetical protein [unclassified Roseobacter]MBF9050635.1 hypothetical protein [Rhodobacterales bacterium HKCCD4356]NNW07086.1 hypothetical protein [Roseobacter sp. HKCCD8431]NNV11947.1 hypothetical protein [Roseobacter sp. HKCCD7357]NNV16960.1 hypothetical protein [Roseobacter sp. HKCCD8768]NNV26189.1 hypothetical protein [Roseobacter sp. HKCCD8192]
MDYPEIESLEHLPEVLLSCGPTKGGGFGPVALDWVDIEAFERLSGVSIGPWGAEAVIAASRAYVAALGEFDQKHTPSPLTEAVVDRKGVNDALKAGFAQMMKRPRDYNH